MSPQSDSNFVVLMEEDIGVVSFSFRYLAHAIYKGQRFRKALKRKIAIDLPVV